MKLKNILKAIKLNESTISMILGALVIIVVGVLVVNYFKDTGKGKLPVITTDNKTEAKPGLTYQIQKGESLWTVAEKTYGSGYNWVDIAKENNIANADQVNEGQEILLPDVEAKTVTTESLFVTSNESVKTDAITGATYEVVKGDNLWNIAIRTYGDGYKWSEIARENNLVNPDLIYPGNILVLPR